MDKNTKPHSYHVFLFPFKWDFRPSGKKLNEMTFRSRTSLEAIKKGFTHLKNWEAYNFSIEQNEEDNYNTYNEFAYFHEHVRGILAISRHEKFGVSQFRYKVPANAQFHINIEGKESPFSLDLKNILVNFYEVGIGFLSFHLENKEEDNVENIKKINDLGRRIYPPFLGTGDVMTDAAKKSFSLPSFVSISGILDFEDKTEILEDYSYFNHLASVNGDPVHLPNHISQLLGKQFISNENQVGINGNYFVLQPVIDDRMFVMTYLQDNKAMTPLKKYDEKTGLYGYTDDKFWYSYLFIDTGKPSCQSKPLMRSLLQKHTYHRWIEQISDEGKEEGVLFGISRYSFVILADRCWFAENVLVNHFNYLYFQMIALAFVQRSGIIRFSAEASRVAQILHDKRQANPASLISDLYLEYIYFINRIYFRELTPQEQGIELYDMVRDIMDIDRNVKDLDNEIEELHKYAMLLEQEKSTSVQSQLTWVATILLPFSIVGTVFGFSSLSENDINFWNSIKYFVFISVFFLIILLLIVFLIKIFKSRKP